MAQDFLAWEKRKGYTTAYSVTYCRGYLSSKDANRFPTWGVRAFCRTHRDLAGSDHVQVWDLFTVYDERVGRRGRCRLWGSTFFTGIAGQSIAADHYVYRPCPRTSET